MGRGWASIVAGCDVVAVYRIIARVRARDDGPGILVASGDAGY
jgi:hypothetical protein